MNFLKNNAMKFLAAALTLAVATIVVNAARPFIQKLPFIGKYI